MRAPSPARAALAVATASAERQRLFDQHFAVAPGDQHIRSYQQVQPEEWLLTDDIGDRLMRQPAIQ